MEKELKIGIAGLGTVGAGVFKILSRKSGLLAKRAGRKIIVSAVSSRDRKKNRDIDLNGVRWMERAENLASDNEIDVVVELIGGAEGMAYELCRSALENKKHVVTANKALIAERGMEFAELAEKNSVALMFEASVAGGIPIIKALKESLSSNEVNRVSGILNGTSNYILSAMDKQKRDFDDVLKEAQKLGYAESDPSFDISGTDAAHKLAILSCLAHGGKIDFSTVYIEGIEGISQDDIAYAREFGYVIRPLAISRATENGVEQRVHPCLVPEKSAIGGVEGVTGAVLVECDELGPAFFSGAGAGQGPTASAVVSDIVDIAANRAGLPFGISVKKLEKKKFADINHHSGAYYIRLNVKDELGVLASITSSMGKEKIGVESVLQRANEKQGTAQIALITHETGEDSMQKALKNIGKMEYVVEKPHMIRIETF